MSSGQDQQALVNGACEMEMPGQAAEKHCSHNGQHGDLDLT